MLRFLIFVLGFPFACWASEEELFRFYSTVNAGIMLGQEIDFEDQAQSDSQNGTLALNAGLAASTDAGILFNWGDFNLGFEGHWGALQQETRHFERQGDSVGTNDILDIMYFGLGIKTGYKFSERFTLFTEVGAGRALIDFVDPGLTEYQSAASRYFQTGVNLEALLLENWAMELGLKQRWTGEFDFDYNAIERNGTMTFEGSSQALFSVGLTFYF